MLSLTQEMMDHAGTNEGYFTEQREERIENRQRTGTKALRCNTIRYDSSKILPESVFSALDLKIREVTKLTQHKQENVTLRTISTTRTKIRIQLMLL